MSKCASCGTDHGRFRDYAHTKPAAYCLACHAKYARENRPKHSELSPEQRKKANARAYANTYQRRGKLQPMACLECGAEKAQKHHPDYDFPLMVEWLCKTCHVKHHHGFVVISDPAVETEAARQR